MRGSGPVVYEVKFCRRHAEKRVQLPPGPHQKSPCGEIFGFPGSLLKLENRLVFGNDLLKMKCERGVTRILCRRQGLHFLCGKAGALSLQESSFVRPI